MGVIKQGILGGFLGKVGGVIGGNFKGIATMRAMPLSVANPKTAPQVENRERFKGVTDLASLIGLNFIQTFWNRAAVKMSGFNLFCSVNKGCIDTLGKLVAGSLKISDGAITAPTITGGGGSAAGGTASIGFTYPLGGDHLVTDQLAIILTNDDGDEVSVTMGEDVTSSPVVVDLPAGLVALDYFQVYLATRRADGTKTSQTAYMRIQCAA